MNDDDYAAALMDELENLKRDLEDAREKREKTKISVEHLEAEQRSLLHQKQQREQRLKLAAESAELQQELEIKKAERMKVLQELVHAQNTIDDLHYRDDDFDDGDEGTYTDDDFTDSPEDDGSVEEFRDDGGVIEFNPRQVPLGIHGSSSHCEILRERDWVARSA